MKLLQVIHGFPPYNIAGSEVYTYNLSRELSKKSGVTVFYRGADPKKDEYATEWGECDGFEVFTINNNFKNCSSFEETYKNDSIAEIFGDFLDQVGPDVVHFHHVTCLSTTLIREAKRRDVPIVYTLHDYWLICQRGQFLKMDLSLCNELEDKECARCLVYQLNIKGDVKKVINKTIHPTHGFSPLRDLLRKIYRSYARLFFGGQPPAIGQIRERTKHIKEQCSLVDVFIAPSRFLRQKYIEFGVSGDKIIYSDYGFDTALFKEIVGKSSDKIRFGYAGTWIPSKGVHVLIEAFNKIKDEQTELKIFGKYLPYDGFPDYLSYLKGLINNERIMLMGEYDNKDIGRVFSEIDVLIVPSIWYENSPLTIHEAFMAGIPVIASDIGGIPELVRHRENGLLFEAGNAEDLHEKIKMIIDRPGLIKELSENIEPVKTIEENAKELEDIYKRLSNQ